MPVDFAQLDGTTNGRKSSARSAGFQPAVSPNSIRQAGRVRAICGFGNLLYGGSGKMRPLISALAFSGRLRVFI
jgi:hypothetical protein